MTATPSEVSMIAQIDTPIYSSLDEALKQIRLLRIQPGPPAAPIICELDTISIEENGIPFDALSYVWGREYCPTPIVLCGHSHQVTSNLHAALKRLRKPDADYTIWIDALCINQEDYAERSSQVGLMLDIYCRAASVIAWLGECDPANDQIVLALRLLEEISGIEWSDGVNGPHWGVRIASFRSRQAHVYTHLLGYCETYHEIKFTPVGGLHDKYFGASEMARQRAEFNPHAKWPPPKHDLGPLTEDDVNSALLAFCELEYWHRIWTLQEILLPHSNAWLLRGGYKAEAGLVFDMFSLMKWHVGDCCNDFARTHQNLFEAGDDLIRAAWCRAPMARRLSEDEALKSDTAESPSGEQTSTPDVTAKFGGQSPPFRDELQIDRLHAWFGTRKASDPRDHVYGLLGLLDATYRTHITPNYVRRTADVFVDATIACVKARRDLRVLELVTLTPIITEGLPSWAMDWAAAESEGKSTPQMPCHLRDNQTKVYDASKSKEARCSFSQDGRRMVVGGVYLGTIIDYLPPIVMVPNKDDIEGRFALVKDRVNLASQHFVALSCDAFPATDEYGHTNHREISDGILASPNYLWANDRGEMPPREAYLLNCIATTLLHDIEQLLLNYYVRFKRSAGPPYQLYTWITEAEYRIRNRDIVDGMISHRWKDINAGWLRDWFFVASNVDPAKAEEQRLEAMRMGNYSGKKPLELGDMVVMLYGSDRPCVLRRLQDDTEVVSSCSEDRERYEFIGTTYVHGLMDSEAVDLVESGGASERDFTIM